MRTKLIATRYDNLGNIIHQYAFAKFAEADRLTEAMVPSTGTSLGPPMMGKFAPRPSRSPSTISKHPVILAEEYGTDELSGS